MKNQDNKKFEIDLIKKISPEGKKFLWIAPLIASFGITIIYFTLYQEQEQPQQNDLQIDLSLPVSDTKELSNNKEDVFYEVDKFNSKKKKDQIYDFDNVLDDPLGENNQLDTTKSDSYLAQNSKKTKSELIQENQLKIVEQQLKELEEKPITNGNVPRSNQYNYSNFNNQIKEPVKKLTEEEKILLEIQKREKLRNATRELNRKKQNSKPKTVREKIKIKAYVYRDQDVLLKHNVNMTLITPFTYKGQLFESGQSLYGTVQNVSDNKVFINIDAVGDLDIKLEAFDARRKHKGLYFPKAGELERELKEELENNSSDVISDKTQNDLIRAFSRILKNNKRRKFTKIPLPNDYEMVFKNY